MKLLLVEDEELTREGVLNYIPWTNLGITHIRVAEDGLEGLEEAMGYQPDIVLADVKMPHMDGITMAFEIQKAISYCRFIFMSGYSEKEYLKSAIKLSAVDYVDKPIEKDKIIEAIKKAIEQLKKEKRIMLLESEFQKKLEDTENKEEGSDWRSSKELAQQVENYINKNYLHNNLTLTVIADHFDVTKQYLCMVYKKEMNRTIAQSIVVKRIVWAKEYLKRDEDVKIKEMAQKSGFSDSNYFIKIFKKHVGITPLEYKNKHSKSKR